MNYSKKINNYNVNFYGKENKYILDCIKTKWISTNGSYVNKFSNLLKKYLNCKYVIPLNSGTSALHLALRVLNVETNDEVIVPTITFIATINSIKYCNASPIFFDTDKNFLLDEKKVINFLKNNTYKKNNFTFNKKTKKKIKAVMVVYTWGMTKNYKDLRKICKQKNIKFIEDAAESLGSKLSKSLHSGISGDIGCFSFNANKIITTGGGGIIATNNKKFAEKAYYLSIQAKDNAKYFVHNDIGYNYRMTNIHAAIGLGQLEKIQHILKLKKKITLNYFKHIKDIKNLSFNYDSQKKISLSNCWMNVVTINKKKFNLKKLIDYMSQKNIDVRPVWKLNHLQRKYIKCQRYKIENANSLVRNSFCLPSSTDLKINHVKYIVKLIKNYLEKYK